MLPERDFEPHRLSTSKFFFRDGASKDELLSFHEVERIFVSSEGDIAFRD